MQELERGDSGLRTFASVQGSLAMMAINLVWLERAKESLAASDGAGHEARLFRAYGTHSGSNPCGLQCRARKTADGYRLTGAKKWIGNGAIADVAVVWAKVEGEDRCRSGKCSVRSVDSWSKRGRQVSRRH